MHSACENRQGGRACPPALCRCPLGLRDSTPDVCSIRGGSDSVFDSRPPVLGLRYRGGLHRAQSEHCNQDQGPPCCVPNGAHVLPFRPPSPPSPSAAHSYT